MITCIFEGGEKGQKRHVTTDAILERNGKILLARRAAHLIEGNKWGLPGGFLDRDENLEEGLRREILEESGYRVTTVTLFLINSTPNRPKEDRQNVNLTFIAIPDKKIQDFDQEVARVEWLPFSFLPKEEEFSFDHFMIVSRYIEYRKKKFDLPVLI